MKSEKEKVFGIYIPEKLEETSKMEVARNGHTLKGKEIKQGTPFIFYISNGVLKTINKKEDSPGVLFSHADDLLALGGNIYISNDRKNIDCAGINDKVWNFPADIGYPKKYTWTAPSDKFYFKAKQEVTALCIAGGDGTQFKAKHIEVFGLI